MPSDIDSKPKKPHFSPSQLNTLSRCGYQYYMSYIEGKKIPPGVAALKGSAVHGAAQVNFDQKIESHVDITVSQAQDAAVAEYETRLEKDGINLTPEDASRGKSIVVGEGLDQAVVMAEAHMLTQAPEYQPILVEQWSRISVPGSTRDLVGVIDLYDDRNRLVDFKTSGKKKNQFDADQSIQLTAYAAFVREETGSYPHDVRLDTLIGKNLKKGFTTDRQVLRTSRNDASVNSLLSRFQAAEATISAGACMQVEPGHWCCNPKWCGYWSVCPHVDSERKALAQITL